MLFLLDQRQQQLQVAREAVATANVDASPPPPEAAAAKQCSFSKEP